MAANKTFRFGPVALTATLTTNLLNPGTTTGGVGMGSVNGNLYILLKHLRVLNKTGSLHNFSPYLGATGANAAGTEVVGIAKTVPANDSVDYNGPGLRLDVGDFLVGGADAVTSLTIMGEGEIGVA